MVVNDLDVITIKKAVTRVLLTSSFKRVTVYASTVCMTLEGRYRALSMIMEHKICVDNLFNSEQDWINTRSVKFVKSARVLQTKLNHL